MHLEESATFEMLRVIADSEGETRNRTRSMIGGTKQAEQVRVFFVSPSLAKVSGLPIKLGRWFNEAEDVPHGPLVAVLSEPFWRSHFQSDRQSAALLFLEWLDCAFGHRGDFCCDLLTDPFCLSKLPK
jgi:hypothetical protein